MVAAGIRVKAVEIVVVVVVAVEAVAPVVVVAAGKIPSESA